jgi:hypothetical protein
MKNWLAVVVAVAVVIALAGCYWASESGQATVKLDLSGVAARGPYDRYARVWLVANDTVYPLSQGTDCVQELIPEYQEISVTLDAIPVGPQYKIWLSIVEEQPGGWYRTDYWAESAPFELFPGAKAAVSFSPDTLYASGSNVFYPVADYSGAPALMERNIVDVDVDAGGVLFAAESGTLHEITSFNYTPYSESLSLFSVPAPTGQTIHSVSNALAQGGSQQVSIDTDHGIFPFNYEGFDSAITSKLGAVSVVDSASAWTSGEDKVLYFRKASGWGGTWAAYGSVSSDWIWANHDAGNVRDMAVSQSGSGGAFFATSDGAFWIDGNYLYDVSQGLNPSLAAYKKTFRAPYRILSLDVFPYEGEELFMGTENGVWTAWTPGELNIVENPQIVSGTEGYRFRKVAVYSGSYPAPGAYLSDAYLFVFNGNALLKYPFAAGLPGRISGMAWYYSASSGKRFLVVSGDEGLVYREF